MTHKHDYWEGWRAWLIPKLGSIVQLLEDFTGDEYYVEAETHNKQFVGRVPIGEEKFEKKLHDMGFHRNPLSAWKSLPNEEQEEGSFRKIGYEDEPEMQLHLIIYDGKKVQNAETDETYLYAHYELRWDVDPIGHYRGHDYRAEEGVAMMKDLLDQNGIPYDLQRPPA